MALYTHYTMRLDIGIYRKISREDIIVQLTKLAY